MLGKMVGRIKEALTELGPPALRGPSQGKLETALEFLQSQGYDLLCDGTRAQPDEALEAIKVARRLASRVSPSGVDIQRRPQGLERLSHWASRRFLGSKPAMLEDVTGPEVMRLAQTLYQSREETLSLSRGVMQRQGGEARPYHALRFRPFPWGRWLVSLNIAAEVSPRSLSQERRQREEQLKQFH